MNANDLKTILKKHKMWLNDEDGGEMADLRGADLSGADLRWADLRGADLRWADLRGADLRGVKHIESARNLFYPLTCPEKGEYTAFKKADEKLLS